MKSQISTKEKEHTVKISQLVKRGGWKKIKCSKELLSLAKGPQIAAKKYTGYEINWFRFYTK